MILIKITEMDLEPWENLRGKIVMVTGASSGIGKELCLDLAKAGCRIIAAARRVDGLTALCDHINQQSDFISDRAVAVELDLCSDEPAIEAAISIAWKAFGRIDALINNAGFRGTVRSPLDLCEDEWNRVMKTNMRGGWLVSKYVCMRMRDAKRGGRVIFIASIDGLHRPLSRGTFAYSASKAALIQMAKCMAMELGEHKIRVNAVSPGIFESEITKGLMQKPWLKNVVRRIVPLRDSGTVDPALTSLVRYLIHDSSEYVSGNSFVVDAGTTLPAYPIFSSL